MKSKDQNTTPAEAVSTTVEVVEPTTENVNGTHAVTITTAMQRSVTSVFEKLQQGQKLQENYQKAKNRLSEIENFKSEFDGSGLEMTIVNRQGAEINFSIQESICKYIDAQIEHGKEVVGFLEAKIVEFSI